MPDLLVIGPVTDNMMRRLAQHFSAHHLDQISDLREWLAEVGTRVEHVLTNGHDGLSPELMDQLPKLKMISCYGVGYDAIDASEAVRRGIVVTHTPNVLNADVASTAVLLMLACYREIIRDDAYVRSGAWAANGNAPLTRSTENQTVGILGMGRIGQEIAQKLAPWSPTILYHSRSEKNVPYQYVTSLKEMARQSDVLICITPGGAETERLVNKEVLHALGSEGTLINVSRGTVVDENSMIDALESGKLGWAGLDVFEDEPRVPDRLMRLKNVVLLPHVGSATRETREAMGTLVVDNLLQHLKDGSVLTAVPECRKADI